MAIPTGPFPAEIDYADLRVGMHIRVLFEYFDSDESLTMDVWISKIDAAGAWATTANLQVANPIQWDDPPTRDETLYLLEEFTGDPNEPSTDSVVKAADGTIYQRIPDTQDPTASLWQPIGATTTTNWAAITSDGPAAVILDGSETA